MITKMYQWKEITEEDLTIDVVKKGVLRNEWLDELFFSVEEAEDALMRFCKENYGSLYARFVLTTVYLADY